MLWFFYLQARSGLSHLKESDTKSPADSSNGGTNRSHRPLPATTQHNGRTSIPAAGFEPVIPAIKRLQTSAIDLKATGINCRILRGYKIYLHKNSVHIWCFAVQT